jgi:hypothetical protein
MRKLSSADLRIKSILEYLRNLEYDPKIINEADEKYHAPFS